MYIQCKSFYEEDKEQYIRHLSLEAIQNYTVPSLSLEGITALYMIFILSLYSEECSNKGGTNAGSCASGFGVCCTCK